jgi:DNA ligase-1
VAELDFRFVNGAIHLPELRLWLDAHAPIGADEAVFVSHAHSDHTARHARVIFSPPTQKLMRARVAGERTEHVLEFGYRHPLRPLSGAESAEAFVTLLPAGHVFGSAMSLLESSAGSLLYTGDFKLRRGLSAEPCEPRPADVLIMETTYGRPQYVFPPTHVVMTGLVRFCREALDNDEVPVLLGYSLGKSQEILSGLAEAGLPIMLIPQIAKLTRVYESFGLRFPAYRDFEAKAAAGHVVLAPPGATVTTLRRRLGRCRIAMLTGWALNAGSHFQFQADSTFPLSDHADFPDLIEFVKRVAPRKVYTLHGFAADFAATLRELGFDAQALSESEQLELRLKTSRRTVAVASRERGAGGLTEPRTAVPPTADIVAPVDSFAALAQTCRAIAGVNAKSEKVRRLAEFLCAVAPEQLPAVTIWFTGLPFAASANRVLAVGWAVIRGAVCDLCGITEAQFRQAYLRHSDTGETVAELVEHRERTQREGERKRLPLASVSDLFSQLHVARGPLPKRALLAGALVNCSGLEAKFLIKILTGDLRIGLREGLVEEAVAIAFGGPAESVRAAHQLVGDLGEVACLARGGRLEEADVVPFRPVKVMLASPEPSAADVMERAREWLGEAGPAGTTVWVEDKFDGIRCQLHKVGDRVALFSRDLKDVTDTFPELAAAARELSGDVILDGEAVAMAGGRALPFAELQRRLGRRERDLFLGDEVPVRFVAFDLLWRNGAGRLSAPLRERRRELDMLLTTSGAPAELVWAPVSSVSDEAELARAFAAARRRGNEGLMIKDPGARYLPGRRGIAWLKLKHARATLDCVVVGAEYGHGKRKQVLSDYTFAVRDERSGELKTIGKAYTGLTDAEIARLTEHFLGRVVRQRGRYFEVVPDTVLEIAFDALQASDRHASGLAMRFPRIARIRDDKSPAEIDTLTTARRLAGPSAA